jgi:hypothetical protein
VLSIPQVAVDSTAVALAVDTGFPVERPLDVALPLQALGLPSSLANSASIRALSAFLASTLFGGVAIYRYSGRLAAAADASTESLPLSVLYGFLAYGLVGFIVAYGYTQLTGLGVGTPALTVLGGVVLGGGLLALSGVGYVVLGVWLTDSAGIGDPWTGLVGVGLVGAAAVLVLPLVAGAVVWFGIAAVGIGGPVRTWVHADATERRADEH